MRYKVMMIMMTSLLASNAALACSFFPIGLSRTEISTVTAALSEDDSISMSEIHEVSRTKKGTFRVELVDQDSLKPEIREYSIVWVSPDEHSEGPDCPTPTAKRLR
ncbi:MAG: hypothetical protein KF789_00805 [Bdellovibrionaceae bacterium]|nr:hypothetical protein [Pseudobdellovibrionaceae bacterium]